MTLIIPPAVIKQMKTMPQTDQARIIEALEQIATQPSFRFSFMTELVGEPGHWRVRKGIWRAIISIENNDVRVIRIAHRRESYR